MCHENYFNFTNNFSITLDHLLKNGFHLQGRGKITLPRNVIVYFQSYVSDGINSELK